jgi:hypothetical protein
VANVHLHIPDLNRGKLVETRRALHIRIAFSQAL